MSSLGKTLLAFDLLHFVLQGQIYLLLQVSLDVLACIPTPYDEENAFFGVISRRSSRIGQLQLLQHRWLGHRLYCDVEWFALKMV